MRFVCGSNVNAPRATFFITCAILIQYCGTGYLHLLRDKTELVSACKLLAGTLHRCFSAISLSGLRFFLVDIAVSVCVGLVCALFLLCFYRIKKPVMSPRAWQTLFYHIRFRKHAGISGNGTTKAETGEHI